MAVAWPKTVKTHNLQRLIWAAKSSRGSNFFLPSLFPRYTILRRPNHAKLTIAWPKTVKTHNLPRSISAAKSSRGANFFHPSHFPRYTSFTASQSRKKGRCLAKNSQYTQFATFNLGCKKFERRDLFSSPAISHVTRLLRRPNHAKLTVAWPKTVKTHNLPRLISAAKSSRGANFFHPQPFPMLHVLYGVPTTQKWPLPGQEQSIHTICHV